MYAVGAILSLPANKRSSIQAVVLIALTSGLQVEACASKACLNIASVIGIRAKKTGITPVFLCLLVPSFS